MKYIDVLRRVVGDFYSDCSYLSMDNYNMLKLEKECIDNFLLCKNSELKACKERLLIAEEELFLFNKGMFIQQTETYLRMTLKQEWSLLNHIECEIYSAEYFGIQT